ncbi:MAG: hypothetical protein DRN40_07560 [Thermoplasmata archaeon]|nr:MAG: hypothetical protein DRN40_07560 [Thermoplasmata archaeon]
MRDAEKTEKISAFVDDVIENKDVVLLDILWMYTYTVNIQSSSGYNNNIDKFRQLFGRTCVRNLQKKYNLERAKIKEKMTEFLDFLYTMPKFLYKENFDNDRKLLTNILTDKASEIFLKNVRNSIKDLSDLDKKILSFVLNYIPIRIQEPIKRGDIAYFEIKSMKEWTDIFNLLFNEELKVYDERLDEPGFKPIWTSRGFRIYSRPGPHESFCQLGDELVKIGVGYWTFYISSKGYVDIEFLIPYPIYEAVEDYRDELLTIKNFEEKINEVEKEIVRRERREEWGLEDLE